MRKGGLRCSFLLVLLLALLPCVVVQGADGQQRVFDEAGLLTSSQVNALEQRIAEISGEIDMDLAIVTTDTNPNRLKTARTNFITTMGSASVPTNAARCY